MAHEIREPEKYSVTVELMMGLDGEWKEIGQFDMDHKDVKEEALAEKVFELDIEFAKSIVKKNTYKRQLAVWNSDNLKQVDFQKTKAIAAEYEFRDDGKLKITVARKE